MTNCIRVGARIVRNRFAWNLPATEEMDSAGIDMINVQLDEKFRITLEDRAN